MTIQVNDLPNDVATLKRLLIERDSFIERLAAEQEAQLAAVEQRLHAEHRAQLSEVERRLHAEYKAALAAILRRYYGPKSETFDPRQLLLFGELLTETPLDEASIAEESGEPLTTRRIKKKHSHGRQVLPAHLERIEIEHDLAPAEKPCPGCGDERSRIGSEISEQLEYFPANFKVLKHVRHKYACAKCDAAGYEPNIVTAPKPTQPIEKGLPGPSLCAYVVTSKLADHLPLYRLENIFARQQVTIARSTMCAWLASLGELVTPLVELMTSRIKQSRVIHTDDTTVPVQSPGEKQCRKGRIWCYLGDGLHPYIVYDYTPDRKRAGPASWLAEYTGYLQADAYGGYDGIFAHQEVIEVACWAHARRKFYDAQDSDQQRAAQMLLLIRELYAVEDDARHVDETLRHTLRQERSVPVLARIKTWLDAAATNADILPRSPMGQAITYARNQWAALCTYTTQGFLAIDNNASERALKRVAIGRKNWLFAGNDRAGHTAARLWSLIASADRHGLDPQAYLTSLFAKLPLLVASGATPSEAQLAEFLPDVWKAASLAEPIPQVE